jgi:hypothetical protein
MIEPPLCLSLRVSTTKSLPFNHRIDSDQAEKAFILDFFPEKNVYHDSMPIHSVKVSTAFSRPSTERCTVLIGIGKDLLLHVLEGSIHGNHH